MSYSPHYRRMLAGAVILFIVGTIWIATALTAHEFVTASIQVTDALFAIALVISYVGLWLLLIVNTNARRLMLVRASATTLTLAIIIGMLELPAKLKWVHWGLVVRALSDEGMQHGTGFVVDARLSFRRIPKLQWSGRPSSDIESRYLLPRSLDRRITFTYDRWGYRNSTDIDQADVVLLGDSYIEGWYVSDEETVAARLASRLGRPVVNLGVAGYGTLQQYRVLQTDALVRNPRAIGWFFFEGNDLYDDQAFENFLLAEPAKIEQAASRAQDLVKDQGWIQRSFVIHCFHLVRRLSHSIIPNRAPYWGRYSNAAGVSSRIYFADYGAVPWTTFEESRWQSTQLTFRDGIAFARNHGIEVILLYVPTKYRVYREFIDLPERSPMQRFDVWTTLPPRFLAFCRSVEVSCIDLTEPLKDALRTGIHVYAPTDTHWTPEGHAIVAGELERAIRHLPAALPYRAR